MRVRIFVLFTLIFSTVILGVTPPNMENLGDLLKANKENSEYINVIVSNLTPAKKSDAAASDSTATGDTDAKPSAEKSDDYHALLLAANKKDFEGMVYYLKGDFRSAFRPIRSAEGILAELFQKAGNKHLDDTGNLLEYCNTRIIRTEDHTAKYYLRMASRHLKAGSNLYTRGFNHSPYQYRKKISLFKGALESSRQARKYAIAALLEYKTEDVDKPEYEKLSFDKYLARKNEIFPEVKVNNYEAVKAQLAVYIENKELPKEVKSPVRKQAEALNLLEIHDDNFGIMTFERKSLLEKILKDLYFGEDELTDKPASSDSGSTDSTDTVN